VRVAGKFFATEGDPTWWLNGVTYGPFPPNAAGEPFPETARLESDLRMIAALGFNTLRVYTPPTTPLRAAARKNGLRLLVTLTWTDHVDFLTDSSQRTLVLETVLAQARDLAGDPVIAAILVGNEIEKSLVRWMGPRRVQRFLERLIATLRRAAPGIPCGYATYPSTGYLMPRTADFFAANLYLEDPTALDAYLQRLQNLAGNKPLLITEFGLDVKAHGVEKQAEVMRWQRRVVLEAGAAGSVWFAFTDEWQRGGRLVTGWQFGLVDAGRQPRPVCALAASLPRQVKPPAEAPSFSVIVCTRNGSQTLRACLESLGRLNYPAFEVLVIDDGSTDAVPDIVKGFPSVRAIRQEPAGLSVARNLGMKEARGSLLAYTDDDCIAHPDWLLHLARAFAEDANVIAAGGPNIPPPPRHGTEAVVAAAPGAPAHVLLNDTEAEHLPGCNLAIRKEALQGIGGFRPVFTTAGDDVDICWRLRETGGRLKFVAGAMVWHHRRLTVSAYLRQQRGYGRAEALLMKAHPTRFGPLGGARWRGCIYGDALPVNDPVEGTVFFGTFGNALFQGIYQQTSGYLVEWLSGLLWPALVLLAIGLERFDVALGIALIAGLGAFIRYRRLPPPFPLGWSQQVLLVLLCLLQPLVRESARVWGMLRLGARPARSARVITPNVPPPPPQKWALNVGEWEFWSESNADRQLWLPAFQKELETMKLPARRDDGWRRLDFEAYPKAEISPAILSVTEYHGGSRCLTRVRFLLRFTPGLLIATLLLLALETVLLMHPRESWHLLGLGSLIATVSLMLVIPPLLLRPLRRAALAAATRVGLNRV
jgi:GT2 family glycosyltransferase